MVANFTEDFELISVPLNRIDIQELRNGMMICRSSYPLEQFKSLKIVLGAQDHFYL